jgi:hypothetical protein
VTDLRKGMLVGASNAVVIAIASAVCTFALGWELHWQRGGPVLEPVEVGLVIALIAVLVGSLSGGLLGALSDLELSPRVHVIVYLLAALIGVFAISLCTLWWPEVKACAFPSSAAHLVILARWTAPATRMPRMEIVR